MLTQLVNSERPTAHSFEKIIIIFDDVDETILDGVSNFKAYLVSKNISSDFFAQDIKGAWTKDHQA